jgi:hypothetical protein
MSLFRDEKNEDEQSCYSSDCSSSPSSSSSSSSSSSCHSSLSNASSSSDEFDGSIVSLSGSGRKKENQKEFQSVEDSFFRLSSLMRHRRTKVDGFQRDFEEGRRRSSNHDNEHKYKYENESAHNFSDDSDSSKIRKRRRRGGNGRRNIEPSLHWSSSLLAISLLIWCGVQFFTKDYVRNQSLRNGNTNIGRLHQPQHHNSFPHRPPPTKKKVSASKKEMLQQGCELDPDWQTPESNSKLLSCQLLHELDLSEALSSAHSARSSSRRRRSLSSSAHLGSGLWRDVWKIRDNMMPNNNNITQDENSFVVLKTMKLEHEVVHRNLERHRREAATMSRLTKSPHVADLYAYCGNSILTEFATQDLSRALNTKSGRDTNDSHTERRKIKDVIRTRRAKEHKEPERQLGIDNFENEGHSNSREIRSDTSRKVSTSASLSLSSSLSTTLPLATRIDWALQASKAIADMHRSDVIHADITTKQFLVISSYGGASRGGNENSNHSVQVKLNDFNRCRFVPRQQKEQGNETAIEPANIANTKSAWSNKTRRCTIRIPSAPGSYRSPEEYSDKALTPQIDVFSLGHVLYEIWTSGQTPWHDAGTKRIKNMVMDGVLPIELKKLEDVDAQTERQLTGDDSNATNEDFLLTENDRAFGRLIRKCYLVDPERRITADHLVLELTKILETIRRQNNV